MDEKGKNIIIVLVALIVATAFGYVVMYIKTPTVKEELPQNNTKKEDIDIDSLNFSHFLYDVDGNSTNETSAKIMNSTVFLYINDNEYTLNNFGNIHKILVLIHNIHFLRNIFVKIHLYNLLLNSL